MSIELKSEDQLAAQRLEAVESSFEALNARIARLAIALHVSLDSDQAISSLMSEHPLATVALKRRLLTERRGQPRTSPGPDRRLAHQREELRGLLVLRYGVETRYVAQHGVLTTRQILVESEAHMTRDGFKPGADGPHAAHLLDKS